MARKKNEITLKEPVRIREKNLKDGNKSLYLDIYMNGNRKKEDLKLYIVPKVNAAAKQQNKNTWKLAEQIKAQCILDIQKVSMVDILIILQKTRNPKQNTKKLANFKIVIYYVSF